MFSERQGRLFRLPGVSMWLNDCIYILNLVLFLATIDCQTALGCWGKTAPEYGDMTKDYSLLVGDDLILNCTLKKFRIEFEKVDYSVNSSNLIFRKDSVSLQSHVRVLDSLTAQLTIPNAKQEDGGMYHCSVSVGTNKNPHVCSSQVSVGYPPKPVRNFQCISRYFENLTCTWDFEDSGIQTNYSLNKYFGFISVVSPVLQTCPVPTSNSTHCQWRRDTEPPYDPNDPNMEDVIYFTVIGTNALGERRFNFSVNHFEIVIPNHPVRLKVLQVTQQSISLQWSPPGKIENKIPLQYQLRIEDQNEPAKIINVGVNVESYTLDDLIPYTAYKICVRCRSNYTSREDMWGPYTSIEERTLADAPYLIPVTIPEAFQLHHYEGYREVSLYWKPVPQMHHNAEGFHYYIQYFSEDDPSNANSGSSINTSSEITISRLQENAWYTFHLHAANDHGLSQNYSVITIDKKTNILPVPKDITVISNEFGLYEISWKPPAHNFDEEMDYVVFYCSSLKPIRSRCEGEIQWLTTSSVNTTLRLQDQDTNFQFAVATKSSKGTSGMEWASCIIPYKKAPSKIETLTVTTNNSTSLKIAWKLPCAALKAVIEKFEIIYCKVNETKQCSDKKKNITVTNPEAESYILGGLDAYTNYSVVIRAYKDRQPSENSKSVFGMTAEGAPTDSPHHVEVFALRNHTVLVKWAPPDMPNGHVRSYFIFIGGKKYEIRATASTGRIYSYYISDLKHYTSYDVELRACVGEEKCSPPAKATVQTDIGVPGAMIPPRTEAINSSFVKVSWIEPLEPNGPISYFEIQWKTKQQGNSTDEEGTKQKIVQNTLTTEVQLDCESVEDGGITYLFSVRAVNIENGVRLQGPLSDPTEARGCYIPQGVAMIIGIAIGGTLALAFTAVLLFKLIKWMADFIKMTKNEIVTLPKGLEEPGTNDLSNPISPTKGGEIKSYPVNEPDNKNRHGSGSSQYSNSSTDELLNGNGPCTKFGRKSSSGSSGCSSMSSSPKNRVRTSLCSDSAAELDSHSSPSPDAVFGDHRSTLPILMESQDSSLHDIDAGIQVDQLTIANTHPDHQYSPLTLSKYLPNGLTIKTDHPYSKFGIIGNNSVPPWGVNPLAFYSCNLANSEPSVFGLEHSQDQSMKVDSIPLSAYSKVGLPRSCGDILRIPPNTKQGLGYSKVSINRSIERSQSSSNTRRSNSSSFSREFLFPSGEDAVSNVQPVTTESCLLKRVISDTDHVSDRDTLSSVVPHKPNTNLAPSNSIPPYVALKNITQRNGMILPRGMEELGHQLPTHHTAAPDYVALKEVQGLHTPKRSPILLKPENLTSVVFANEHLDKWKTGIFQNESLKCAALDETGNAKEDPNCSRDDSQNGQHSTEALDSERWNLVSPCLTTDVGSCNGFPDSEHIVEEKESINQPDEVLLDFALVPPIGDQVVGDQKEKHKTVIRTDSQERGPDVTIDVDKQKLTSLHSTPLKTVLANGFVSSHLERLPNSSSKDLPDDYLASDEKRLSTGSSKDCHGTSLCPPRKSGGYVPFVSLVSCNGNSRISGESNGAFETSPSESRDFSGKPIETRTTVSTDQVSNNCWSKSPDPFTVPEQTSARNHSNDSTNSSHLKSYQREMPENAGSTHEGPMCTRGCGSKNGSLEPCYHLVPMVESEICEV